MNLLSFSFLRPLHPKIISPSCSSDGALYFLCNTGPWAGSPTRAPFPTAFLSVLHFLSSECQLFIQELICFLVCYIIVNLLLHLSPRPGILSNIFAHSPTSSFFQTAFSTEAFSTAKTKGNFVISCSFCISHLAQ